MVQRRTSPLPATPAGAARSTGRSAVRSTAKVKERAAGEAQEVASTAADHAQDVASTAAEKGQEVVAVATDQAREVTDTVRSQAARVGGEALDQGRTLAEEAKSQLERQAHAQSRRLADMLSTIGDEVQALAEGRPDDAQNLKPYVSNAADAVYEAADRLYGLATDIDNRGITGVLEDVQTFARRRPGAFLLGAAVAGFGIGRAVRANSADDNGAADGYGSGQPVVSVARTPVPRTTPARPSPAAVLAAAVPPRPTVSPPGPLSPAPPERGDGGPQRLCRQRGTALG